MLVKYHGGLCVFGRGQRSEQAVLPLLPPVSISLFNLAIADPGVLHQLTQLIGAECIVVNSTADLADCSKGKLVLEQEWGVCRRSTEDL